MSLGTLSIFSIGGTIENKDVCLFSYIILIGKNLKLGMPNMQF